MPRFAGAHLFSDRLLVGTSAILSEFHSKPEDQTHEKKVGDNARWSHVNMLIDIPQVREIRTLGIAGGFKRFGSLVRFPSRLPLQLTAQNRNLTRAARSNR